MAAVYVSNIVINAGTDFSQTFILEDNISNSSLDLTTYSMSAQMRKWSGSSSSVVFSASTIFDPAAGNVKISLGSTITTSLKPGRYVYDVIITNASTGIKTRVIEGMALVREGVTR